MSYSHRNKKKKQSCGNALVVTLLAMMIVAAFIALALDYTGGVSRNVQRSLIMRQAMNIADAATETAFASWRAICIANSATLAPTGSFFPTSKIATPTTSDFPGVKQYTLTNYRVDAADVSWKAIPAASPVPRAFGVNTSTFSYYYVGSADVIMPTISSKNPASATDKGNIIVHVRRVFEKARQPISNGMAWFKDDLEIHPGPPFLATGDVHTNGSLYTGHNSLTLSGNTTYSNLWSVGFKPSDSTHPETPTMPKWMAGKPVFQAQPEVPYGVDATDYHKLIEPISDTTDPLYPYTFANKADATKGSGAGVQVYIAADNSVTVYNEKGVKVTSASGGNDANLYNTITGALTTNETIIDNREGATTGNANIRVATLDVGKITTAISNNAVQIKTLPVIYITDASADANGITAKRAIRLKNGGWLPPGGLTVASGNPVYIQGDFNTGTIVTGTNPDGTLKLTNQPTSSDPTTPDPTKPTASNYTRQPAAVIADAVNILSNTWVDSKAGTVPAAINTTVNVAVISGNVPSGGGKYSGGLENFPRFLENWSGKTLTYYGSMLQLYPSEQAIGTWGSANVYSPPNRAWYFDTEFLTDPPPGIPYTVDYRRSRWYVQ